MAEGTYEYECERAELLGVAPPNRTVWEEAERVRKENQLAEEMTVCINLKTKKCQTEKNKTKRFRSQD